MARPFLRKTDGGMEPVGVDDFRTVRDQAGLRCHADLAQFPAHIPRRISVVMDGDRRVNAGAGIGFHVGPFIGPWDGLAHASIHLPGISIGGCPNLGLGRSPFGDRRAPVEPAVGRPAFRLGGGAGRLLRRKIAVVSPAGSAAHVDDNRLAGLGGPGYGLAAGRPGVVIGRSPVPIVVRESV